MDILKPDCVWIENRCYRRLQISEACPSPYVEPQLYPMVREEKQEVNCSNLPIKFENNQFWISIPVPGPLIGYVVGKFQQNIKNIMESTGTQIKVPSRDNLPDKRFKKTSNTEKSSEFVITGDKRPSVAAAYERIERIMISGRWKIAESTHFVSIPVNNDAIQEQFQRFREDVLNSCGSARGIKEAIFTIPCKLHLTIIMLTLLDDREKELAKLALNDSKSQILNIFGGNKLQVNVQGIEYMNDDPAEVDVLYGKVYEEDSCRGVLQTAADTLADIFANTNLAQKDHDYVKLHVTLMRSPRSESGRSSFDARPLLQKFNDYAFGSMDVTEIHVSTRHTGNNRSYYTPCAKISL